MRGALHKSVARTITGVICAASASELIISTECIVGDLAAAEVDQAVGRMALNGTTDNE